MKEVLVVASDSVVIKAIIQFCEERGDKVVFVKSGAMGLSFLLTKKFDAVITTLFIDDLDAVQLIQTIKSSDTMNSLTPMALISSDAGVSKMFQFDKRPDVFLKKDASTLEEFEKFYAKLSARDKKDKVKILYVEDDKLAQKMVKMWLEKIDKFTVEICPSLEAVQNYTGQKFDLIISDNILGDGESKDVIGAIQATSLKGTPIVIFTASPEKLNLTEYQRLGKVLGILPKPFELKAFLQIVEDIKL